MPRVPNEVKKWFYEGDKSDVLKRLESLVVWMVECSPPVLDIWGLIFAMNLPNELSEDRDAALRKAVEAGLLSFESDGNYDMQCGESTMFPGHSFNPKLEGRKLFFVGKYDGRTFLKRMSSGWGRKVNVPKLRVVSGGEYPITFPISFEKWREIFVKGEDFIYERLEKAGVLVSSKEGNGFRVVKPNAGSKKKREYYFDLGRRFFRRYEEARDFRSGVVGPNPHFSRLPIARYVDGEMVEEDYEMARAEERDRELEENRGS